MGNCVTEKESQNLWYKVKKLHSTTLDGLPSIYPWRKKGLSRAMMTTNPLRASQELFPASIAAPVTQDGAIDMDVVGAAFVNAPKKPDKLLVQMNQGHHSLLKCNGEWVIQVAEFSGRSVIADGTNQSIDGKVLDKKAVQAAFSSDSFLKKSPLAQAADDAENLAASLAKSKKLGTLKPYVYHDRFSSKVFIGPFNSPNDPNVAMLLKGRPVQGLTTGNGIRLIDEISFDMLEKKAHKNAADPRRPAHAGSSAIMPDSARTSTTGFDDAAHCGDSKREEGRGDAPTPRPSLGTECTAPSVGGLDTRGIPRPSRGRGRRRYLCRQCPEKAVETALALGEWAVADDSGLSVDALQGAPGVLVPASPEFTATTRRTTIGCSTR